jgi:biotin carboxyl carrier protein
MKLTAEIASKTCALEIRREGSRVFAEIAGRSYDLEAQELGAGGYLFLLGGRVYECRVSDAASSAGKRGRMEVQVQGQSYGVTVFDPRRLRGARPTGGQDAARVEVSAPMHGKIVRVLVERGQVVEDGDGLVVVEAMKMQNELKSPRGGTVAELHAVPGTTVNAGAVLVIIE